MEKGFIARRWVTAACLRCWQSIIFVMNYLNKDYSLNNSFEQPLDSSESEVEFLKVKMLETHSKLIKELEYSKDLEETLEQTRSKQSVLERDNEEFKRRLSALASKQDRAAHDKIKHFELTLLETDKKNDLLRSDLENMRTKTLDLAALNKHLEEQNNQYERSQGKLSDKLNSVAKEMRTKDVALDQFKQEVERYRVKYEKQLVNNQEAERELEDVRRQRAELVRRDEELEAGVRAEKEKQSKQLSEILMLQKEAKEWKGKVDSAHEQASKFKDEVHHLKVRAKSEERNLASELERLTHDYNNLQSMFKQKEVELESARRKPLQDVSRKKNGYEQTKQLISKLQREEHRQLLNRSSPSRDRVSPGRTKPARSYKQEKQEYLSMIGIVGSMESEMLSCNMEKKKILGEIDKIDETRVKTKEMIARRRRLEVQLQTQERKLDHARNQLKRMKVM